LADILVQNFQFRAILSPLQRCLLNHWQDGFGDVKTDRLSFLQWQAIQDSNGQWTFNDVNDGVYMGYQGSPSDLTPIVGVDNPMPFDVWAVPGQLDTVK
jgi:hypothetical protein